MYAKAAQLVQFAVISPPLTYPHDPKTTGEPSPKHEKYNSTKILPCAIPAIQRSLSYSCPTFFKPTVHVNTARGPKVQADNASRP